MIIFGTDFDGTLYFHDREEQIQSVDVEAIKNFQKTGNLFGLVTGRGTAMWKDVEVKLKDKVQFDFRIHSNGACILDRDGNALFKQYIPEDVFRTAFEHGKHLELVFHAQKELYVLNVGEFDNFEGVRCIHSIDEMEADEVFEISFRADNPKGQQYLEYLRTVPGLEIAANAEFVDVMAKGMTKGFGVKKMLELTHQSGMTCAIGDSYNDQSMLEQTDLSFTFPTSPQVVQNSADRIVENIAQALDYVIQTQN